MNNPVMTRKTGNVSNNLREAAETISKDKSKSETDIKKKADYVNKNAFSYIPYCHGFHSVGSICGSCSFHKTCKECPQEGKNPILETSARKDLKKAEQRSRNVREKMTEAIKGIERLERELQEAIAENLDTAEITSKIVVFEKQKGAALKMQSNVAVKQQRAKNEVRIEEAEKLDKTAFKAYKEFIETLDVIMQSLIIYERDCTVATLSGGPKPQAPYGENMESSNNSMTGIASGIIEQLKQKRAFIV